MRRIALLALPLLIAACAKEPAVNPDPNHTHADFAVWINGEQLDFSADKYMSGLSTDDSTHDEQGEHRHQYLHLHDNNGDIIHRHKPGLTLHDFLMSLGFGTTPGCLIPDDGKPVCDAGDKRWRMFVNGEEWPFDTAYDFNDVDQILLTYGSSDDEIAPQLDAMTDDACLYSRTCPERGDPPTENCIADPAVPCVAPDL